MSDFAKKVTDLVTELEDCRSRALEIELQLSIIDEALQSSRVKPRSVGRPRGRPRKVVLEDPVDSDVALFREDAAAS